MAIFSLKLPRPWNFGNQYLPHDIFFLPPQLLLLAFVLLVLKTDGQPVAQDGQLAAAEAAAPAALNPLHRVRRNQFLQFAFFNQAQKNAGGHRTGSLIVRNPAPKNRSGRETNQR